MDFGDDAAEAQYRERLRVAPAGPSWTWQPQPKPASLYNASDTRAWHRRLYDAGYIGQSWPTEIGGRGLGPT
jgi:hypothetical protein